MVKIIAVKDDDGSKCTDKGEHCTVIDCRHAGICTGSNC